MSRYVTSILAALAFAFVLSPASAQQSLSPEEFAREVAISNAFEIEAAELAIERGKDPRAIGFARDMLRDHGRASAELMDAAKMDGVSISEGLDDRRQKQLDALKAATGADFDQAYLSTQVTAHENAVALLDAYAKSDNPGSLKSFAQQHLGTLRTHNIRVHDLTDRE
ncbi:DUF4142 domain-containing protein [Brucella tritici]|uniref:DUF4142 domain-containing protein n=1 Tax=Brucella tritici TaxID=94626 RepID=A0A7V7VQI1_9HYPH|nr:DUF4142 domain-containing protein [Brucella tritici]KAB2654855.1 DUF4142 domain-containing protein [Brucella tritici]